MSKPVTVPKPLLVALGALLFLSLLAVAYLMGQRNAAPAQSPSPTPALTPPAMIGEATPAARSLEERLDALDKRVGAHQQQLGQTPGPASNPAPSSQSEADPARAAYFQQLDSILGRSAFASPEPFAAKLMPQAMAGGKDELRKVFERTQQAREAVAAIEPPQDCQDHHALVLSQLDDAVVLLGEVQDADATTSVDSLKATAARVEASQGQAQKLQQLDLSLRPAP